MNGGLSLNIKRKIGFLGGTFDPIHVGHIELATYAKEQLSLDEVKLIPAYIQPFKTDRKVASSDDRLSMIYSVLKDIDGIGVSEYEMIRKGISYTYDTIVTMKQTYTGSEIVFIMGSDSLMSIEKWHKGKELLTECSFAIGLRPTNDKAAVQKQVDMISSKYGTSIDIIEKLITPISSTEIRDNVRNGKSIRGLVDERVERYIHEQGLYI